jgi:Zn finger protein HypA/HybF involved in hydrogenase expression
MLCEYGCGKKAEYQLKNGKFCCSKRPSGCDILKKINSEGTKRAYNTGKRLSAKERYSTLPEETKQRMNWSKGKSLTPSEEIFVENSLYANEFVKQRIVKDELIEYKCNKCGIDSWQGESIVLDLDHINGNNKDNRLSNLRYLCPNCHSQTETYKGRNKNTGKRKISDEELLTAYKKYSNIRQSLLSVGLAAKGGNYERLKKLIARMVEFGRHKGLERKI